MRSRSLVAIALAAAAGSFGCVSMAKYDKLAQDASQAKLAADAKSKQDDDEITRLRIALKNAEDAAQDRDGKITELSTSTHNLQASLDEQTAINQRLRAELERLGKDVDQVLKDRGTISKELADAKSRLDELRRAQAAAEARTQLFRDFARKLAPMIEGKQLAIGVKNGLLVMTLDSDLLFDPGKADIKTAGQGALMEIAHAIGTGGHPAGEARRFQVGVHTDGTHPVGKRFADNWELSSMRAAAIVRFMVKSGAPAETLAATGFGDSEPALPNDNDANRAKNRRVDFVLEPRAEDMLVPAEWKP